MARGEGRWRGEGRRRDYETDDLRYGERERTPDRRPRGMRDEVDYDRDYSGEAPVSRSGGDYGSYGGYGRGEGAMREYRGSAYGGRGRGEGAFADYGGSADWYEGGYGDPRSYPTARYDERPQGGYARGGGYMDRGTSGDRYKPVGFADRGYDEEGYSRGRRAGAARDRDRDFWDRAGDEVASWFGDEGAERRREEDHRHRGRGPRDYVRSDERILEDVNDRLTDDGSIDASDISVQVAEREVTLTGEVESRAEKRRAEDVAEMVTGVIHVQNNLRVRNRDARMG